MKASRLRKQAGSMALGILAEVGTARGAALRAVLCCLGGCLFMSAGVPSEAMWPPPPLPSDSPGAPRATGSQAVSSDSGAWGHMHVDLTVQGMMGEECQPHCCHW